MSRRLLIFAGAVLLLCGTALAHSHMRSAAPAPDSQVKGAPATVRITFSEPIEPTLSVFKVYSLGVSGKSAKAVEKAVAALFPRALRSHDDDAGPAGAGGGDGLGNVPHRVDTEDRTVAGGGLQVTLKLKPHLKPGAYLVMWKVMSADGHVSRDSYTFSVVR